VQEINFFKYLINITFSYTCSGSLLLLGFSQCIDMAENLFLRLSSVSPIFHRLSNNKSSPARTVSNAFCREGQVRNVLACK